MRAQLPIFQLQGFTDDLFPLTEALRMYRTLKTLDPQYPIASYFGEEVQRPGMGRTASIGSAWHTVA